MSKKEFDLKEIIMGEYFPGVYIIKMKKTFSEDIQYDDFDIEDWRTFIHEYVHFLQDISTRHGYMFFSYKSKLMSLALYAIVNDQSKVIELPIRTENSGIPNAFESETLLDFYTGDYAYHRYHHINEIKIEFDKITTEVVLSSDKRDNGLSSVNIYYDDNKLPYVFGNECVIESMAYLIEHHLFGAEVRKQEFPYNACEAICQDVYPELLNAPRRIVMLAETALMHEHCGLFFYKMVELCAQLHMADFTDDSFLKFCVNNTNATMDGFSLIYNEAVKGIDILFPVKFPYSYLTNEQIKVFLKCGYNFRKTNPMFISNAFDSDDPTSYFKWLISILDTPMIIDGKNDYYGKTGVQNMPVADAVIHILTDKSKDGCGLQMLCKESHISSYDPIICTNAPWENCMCKEVCPVAMYFKGYGVDEKVYRWRTDK